MENAFGITREEVIDLAATKLADSFDAGIVERAIRDKVTGTLGVNVAGKIDKFLTSEMEKLIGQEITPVDIWGESTGKPTTIRAELAKRARDFWSVRIDVDGRESHYGGTERSKVLMQQILKDTFAQAVKENADVIIAEFKEALKTDATKLVNDHIDKLIVVKSKKP